MISVWQQMYVLTEKQLRDTLHAHPDSPCVHERLGTLLFKACVSGEMSRRTVAHRLTQIRFYAHAHTLRISHTTRELDENKKYMHIYIVSKKNIHHTHKHTNTQTHTHIHASPPRSERVPEAKELYRKALALDPTYGLAHYNLSQLLKHMKLIDEQVHHLAQALKFNPKVG